MTKTKEFTPEEIKALHAAMHSTWQTIGGDVMQVEAEMGNKKGRIPKEQVIEVVLDANYMETNSNIDKELLKRFKALSYDEMKKIARKTFIYKWYE